MGSVFFHTGQTRVLRLAVLRQGQYLPRPERGDGQVLFCRGPWPGLEGAALVRRSVFFSGSAMKSFTEFESAFLAALPQERSELQGLQGAPEAQLSAWIVHLFQKYLGYTH